MRATSSSRSWRRIASSSALANSSSRLASSCFSTASPRLGFFQLAPGFFIFCSACSMRFWAGFWSWGPSGCSAPHHPRRHLLPVLDLCLALCPCLFLRPCLHLFLRPCPRLYLRPCPSPLPSSSLPSLSLYLLLLAFTPFTFRPCPSPLPFRPCPLPLPSPLPLPPLPSLSFASRLYLRPCPPPLPSPLPSPLLFAPCPSTLTFAALLSFALVLLRCLLTTFSQTG